jgi:hypothetical protein
MTDLAVEGLTQEQVDAFVNELDMAVKDAGQFSYVSGAAGLVLRIAQAAAKAERERCAKVAEAERVFVSAPGHPSAPERIAAAIRGDAK